MGIIQVSKNFIPDYLKGLVGFPGSDGIGSCSTPASGPSFPVFFFMYICLAFSYLGIVVIWCQIG